MRPDRFYPVFFIAAAANALIKPAFGSYLGAPACANGACSVNPIVLATLALAISLTCADARERRISRMEIGAFALGAALLLAPIAMASWLALGLVAFAYRARAAATERTRAGAEILLMNAARVPVTTAALSLLAGPLLAFDAAAAGAMLALIGGDRTVDGNVVLNGDGHALLVMTGCTSYSNIGFSLLAWFAATRPFFPAPPIARFIIGALLTPVLIIAMISLVAVLAA
ncbi:MAG: hypothetical protein AAGJ87_01685, partial [Pseudomonadota bacterium]